MTVLRRLVLALLFVAIPLSHAVAAPPLRLRLLNNSDWDLTFDVTNLTGGAGTDFPADIESPDGQQELWIQNSTGNWRIDVSRLDATWDAGIRIYVKRTSAGNAGTVSGGTAYQEITAPYGEFFTGTGDPRYITLQFMTNGAFAGEGVPSGSYSTTVTYTVTDNL